MVKLRILHSQNRQIEAICQMLQNNLDSNGEIMFTHQVAVHMELNTTQFMLDESISLISIDRGEYNRINANHMCCFLHGESFVRQRVNIFQTRQRVPENTQCFLTPGYNSVLLFRIPVITISLDFQSLRESLNTDREISMPYINSFENSCSI